MAGEAALTDLFTNGRLEFGIARGAFQYEFDRMAAGLPQEQGGEHMREMLPAVKALWQGDDAHEGKFWNFPAATSVPKPIQKPALRADTKTVTNEQHSYHQLWVNRRASDIAIKRGKVHMGIPLHRDRESVSS